MAACSGDSRPPGSGSAQTGSNASGITGSGGSASNSGGAGGSSSGGDAAGTAGQAGAPGEAGAGPEPPDLGVCGDGRVSSAEECEPGAQVVASCSSLGFESGVLRCGADCFFDKSDCRGTERCVDGRDNDGDARVDCLDADCEESCRQACEAPSVLTDGSSISADTEGRPSVLTSSCARADGPELVFEVTAENTGKLSTWVSARGLVTLSVRSACADDASEAACVVVHEQGGLDVDVTSGDVLFVAVESYTGGATGNLTLEVASRAANACGDAFVDEAEECDDGGAAGGDGCSSTCQVEVTESEPNDDRDAANAYADPTYALISPEGDADYYSFVIEDGPKTVTIDVLNVGSGFCSDLAMDPYLELFDANAELVAEDDDGGDGYCSKLTVPGLEDGEYFVVVSASESATMAVRPTFGYELSVVVD